jgi:hypothetical protein
MSCAGATSRGPTHDLVRGARSFLLLWGLPLALVVLGLAWPRVQVWLWVPAGVIAGSACLANASRCGRLHCYLTGPLFLAGAAATLLAHLGVLRLDPAWILAAMVIGTGIGYAAEWIRGAYVGASDADGGGGDA